MPASPPPRSLWNPLLAGLTYLMAVSSFIGFLLAGSSRLLALAIIAPLFVLIYMLLALRVEPLSAYASDYRLRHVIVMFWAAVATVLAVVVTF